MTSEIPAPEILSEQEIAYMEGGLARGDQSDRYKPSQLRRLLATIRSLQAEIAGYRTSRIVGTVESGANRIAELEAEVSRLRVDREAAKERIQQLEAALSEAVDGVQMMQDRALERFRAEGFVFNEQGGRWEKMAFTLYNDLVALAVDAQATHDSLLSGESGE